MEDQAQDTQTRRHGPSWPSIVIILLILVGGALTGYYGVRVLRSYQQFHTHPLHPGVTDPSLIRDWMTIRYIARAYRVPEEILWQGLGIPEAGNQPLNLRDLNRKYKYGTADGVLVKIRMIISVYEKGSPPQPTVNPSFSRERTPELPTP